jgi:phage FluMu protein Com
MLTFICDNCEKALEVDDNQAGLKVKCPYCGDVNIVPGASTSTPGTSRATVSPVASGGASVADAMPKARPDRAAAAGFPPSNGPEAFVRQVRSSMFRARPWTTLLMFVLIAGGGIGGVALAFMTDKRPYAIACAVAFVVGLLWLGVWKVLALEVRLEITTKRTIERRGLFSKSTTEVMHADIRNFQLSQSFWQRLLNVGTIGISSAANEDVEIVMKNVPKPEEVRKIIDLYRPI